MIVSESYRSTCNERVAPDVAPMSYPNNKPPKAGNKNLEMQKIDDAVCQFKNPQSKEMLTSSRPIDELTSHGSLFNEDQTP